MKKKTKSVLETMNFNSDDKLKITIEGTTEIPFWEHDLKLEAAIALLSTVDTKHFIEDGKYELLEKYTKELLLTIQSSLDVDLGLEYDEED